MYRVMDTYTEALIEWCRYFVATEAFDRSLTSLRHPRTGDAEVSSDPWVRGESTRFARECARRMQLPDDANACQSAKERASGWSFREQQDFLARHAPGHEPVSPRYEVP